MDKSTLLCGGVQQGSGFNANYSANWIRAKRVLTTKQDVPVSMLITVQIG